MLTVLISCKTLQKDTANKVQIETEFPKPYDSEGNSIVELNNETVEMPLWYWLKIVEYAIDVKANTEL